MSYTLSSRTVALTILLISLIAVIGSANLGNELSFGVFAAKGTAVAPDDNTKTAAMLSETASTTPPMIVPSLCPGAGFWSEQAHPTAADGAASDRFGFSVAISGDTAVVGALEGDATGGVDAGAAYVYVRSGTVWAQQQKLTASDSASGDRFGFTVAISGDTIIVGADLDDNGGGIDAGSAYVFVRSGTVWSEQQKLTASDAVADDRFGRFVSISGHTVAVGAPFDDNAGGADAGSVYVFTRSGTVWSQQQKIAASDGAASDSFSAVSLDGDTLAVGAPLDDTAAGTDAGSAYVFTRSGTVWSQQQKLTASVGAANDQFGISAEVSGDTLIVGAYFDDTPGGTDAGSAYIFTRSGVVWTQQQQITASDGAADDRFGFSVAVSGETVVVGAYLDDSPGTNSGSAYVFRRYNSFWAEEKHLTASDGLADDQFGLSVGIDGDTAIAGAWLDDTAGGANTGSAYIFTRSCIPTISSVPVVRSPGAGVSNSTIANVSDGEQTPDTLAVIVNGGASATVNGVTVNNISVSPSGVVTADVVAAAGASDASFTLTVTDNTALSATSTLAVIVLSECPETGTWNQQAHPFLSSGGVHQDDAFGYSVAVSGDTAVVGVYLEPQSPSTNEAGAAYVFVRSGAVWTVQQELSQSDRLQGDRFGISVGIIGDTIIVGAYLDDNGGGTDAGSAYVFTRSGTVWTEQQKLTASDGSAGDFFGVSVATSGDTAIVGAPNDGVPGGSASNGSAYIFTRSGTVWTQRQKLAPSNSGIPANFGTSVAVSADTAIVGAPFDNAAAGSQVGSAYVFIRSGTVWTQQQLLSASDGALNDAFGRSVGISGDTLIISASQDDHAGGENAGSAYVFTRGGTSWTEQQKLTASDGAAFDEFGKSVSISGDTVVVGASHDDTAGGVSAGSAYIFMRSGTVWTQQQKMTASDGAGDDHFGISVAISGDTVVVGAPEDDTAGGTNAGSAYVFKKNCPAPTPTNTPTDTPTATATDTPTPTPTASPAETPSISGTITYGNAIGNPVPPRFVKNVSVSSTAGSPAVGPIITGTPGTYTLTGFGSGAYTVKPTKPGGSNGAITSNDAARVAQGVVSSPGFVSQNQRFAADVSGNGGVTSNDAALIARCAAGLTGAGNAGQWKFFVTGAPSPLPTAPQTYDDSRTYASVTSNLTGEDYIGILVGEVSGNWNPATHPRPVVRGQMSDVSEDGRAAKKPIAVTAEHVATAAVGKEIIIPVSVEGVADKEIISYEFDLRYDPSVMQPMENPVDVSGTVSRGLFVVANPHEPGLLRVVVYGAMAIDEDGVLLNLRFTAVGGVGSISYLKFENLIFNEGDTATMVTDGLVEISGRNAQEF